VVAKVRERLAVINKQHRSLMWKDLISGSSVSWRLGKSIRSRSQTDFKKAYDSNRREGVCNILTESGIPMKLVRLIRMCVNETYSRDWVDKHLSDVFPVKNGLKQGDALLPLIFSFALEYVIRRVEVNQDGLKLNGLHQLLVYADDVNILGGSIHTISKNTDAGSC
jgi:hypothetical protein